MTNSAGPDRALRVGLLSISDRASAGVYADQGIPALSEWLAGAFSVASKMAPPHSPPKPSP